MISFLYIITFSFAWEVKSNSDGATLHWKKSEINYYINTESSPLTAEETESALVQAAQGWNFSHTELIYDGTTNIKRVGHEDEKFTVFFDQNWSEDPDILALTYTWSNGEGEIVHFDIAINAEDHTWSTDGNTEAHDLQNTITHEFGHVLGLDHSEIPDATMSPSAPAGELAKRELHEDDIMGYQVIYPEPLTGGDNAESSSEANENNGSGNHASGGGSQPPPTTGGYGLTMPKSGCAHQNGQFSTWGFLLALLGWCRLQKRQV